MATDQEIRQAKPGAVVDVGARLKRRRAYMGRPYTTKNTWERVELSPRKIGVIVGWRTLSNGFTDYIGSEEGYAYVPEAGTYRVAALVVCDARQAPFLAWPEDVAIVTPGPLAWP